MNRPRHVLPAKPALAPLTFLAMLLFAALANSPASAAGAMNLGWNDCAPLGSATANEAFACNTNSGGSQLYASFVPPTAIPALNGALVVLYVQTGAATLSPWWHMEVGGCRAGLASLSVNFTGGPFTCIDPWQGQASAGMDYTAGLLGPNTARIRAVCALPPGAGLEQPVDTAHEYYAFQIRISHSKTTGTGACAGCLDPACFVLNSLELDGPNGVPQYVITTGGPQSMVTWRGGSGTNCTAVTPARSRTWGQVKALYR